MGTCLWLARACSTPARAWSTLALAASMADLEISAALLCGSQPVLGRAQFAFRHARARLVGIEL